MNDRRLASAHVFVDDLEAPELDADDRHHLVRVLRLRDGEIVTASDGRGRWRTCRFAANGVLVTAGAVVDEQRDGGNTAVVFALTKGGKPELVVQKLTEIGVDRIVPIVSERSVARWDSDKAERGIDRLRKVAREAAMQSRRTTIPVIGPLMGSLSDAVAEFGESAALAEPDAALFSSTGNVSVLIIGPEGGFSPSELAACRRHVSLPGGVLRAETAAIVAGVLLVQSRVELPS